MSTSPKLSSRVPRQNDGKIVVSVLVSIGKPTTPDDHRVVEQRLAVNILRIAHALEKIRKLLEIECVDP